MRSQKGFTLIELIIVIVVLGILAVTAAPQFIDFSGDARTSSVKGLKGALQGAAQSVYGKSAVQGRLSDGYADLNNDGNDDTTNGPDISTVNGYPDASETGIVRAASLGDEGTDWDWFADSGNSIIYIGPADFIDDTGAAGDFNAINGAGGCYVSYTESIGVNQPPEIAVDTAGCGN